ncbi:hypothetical protein Rleg_6919 (plasmid) [Rhizobium leguminosarum bv. trifolii WSM1325]|uniref:Uncharacterized protein n=1 Tax=Rhizobium leguminosarum bv. trifolii (strain WSM1325) TaxID=395491 RepID=C6B794_RHILS|nr:hypothetical protein Rleg_6919 [Rhizobium leguminosarum bv. trifolii WSM1325]
MRAAGSVTVRHVISRTPKNQWYVAEAAKVMRSFRRNAIGRCWVACASTFGWAG